MNLNDDILFLVFEYLNLEDQCSAAAACIRFHAILACIWQKSFKKFVLHQHEWRVPHRHLVILMESICDTVESMELNGIDLEKWNIIKQLSYPNLRSLSLKFDRSYTESDSPVDISKLFPNLRSLALGNIDIIGEHIFNLKSIGSFEEFTVDYFTPIELRQIEKLLEENRLKSLTIGETKGPIKWKSDKALEKICELEKIHLNDSLALMPSSCLLFKNLKELSFNNTNSETAERVYKFVSENMHNELTEFHTNGYTALSRFFKRTFENLTKVKLICDNLDDISLIRFAPNLREVDFIGCYVESNHVIVDVLNLSQIEHVEVFKCQFRFGELDLNVNEIVRNRKKVLNLNFFDNKYHNGYNDKGTNYDEVVVKVENSSSLLNITHLPPDRDRSDMFHKFRQMWTKYFYFKFQ